MAEMYKCHTPTQTQRLPLFEQPTRTDYEMYDTAHPEVWKQFEAITLDLIEQGKKHYGAKAVFEIIRYHRIVGKKDNEFKCNNNMTQYYALKFMKQHPEHTGFFETRKVSKVI